MTLRNYRTLGRSGLVVSPLTLGTMTFGTPRWGADAAASGAIIDAYLEAGGNAIDTADVYAQGESERIVGAHLAERKLRDRVVLATKFSWNLDPGNPNAGGNGAKNVQRALEASLRRLRTDYIDLYWLHFWDMVTPVEEVLQTFETLVRAGKVRYFALSDVPAWYATKMAVLARARGLPGPIALQMEYSLVERGVEFEHLPAAQECGMGLTPWSPLAGGFLAGKYTRESKPPEGRLSGANPFGDSKFTERNWLILDVLRRIATETGHAPAQLALAWAVQRPGVGSVLVGASRVGQLHDNVAALSVELSPDHLRQLDEASAPSPTFPYSAFSPGIRRSLFGGQDVRNWDEQRAR